jgi:hypothetical protein
MSSKSPPRPVGRPPDPQALCRTNRPLYVQMRAWERTRVDEDAASRGLPVSLHVWDLVTQYSKRRRGEPET